MPIKFVLTISDKLRWQQELYLFVCVFFFMQMTAALQAPCVCFVFCYTRKTTRGFVRILNCLFCLNDIEMHVVTDLCMYGR